MEEIAEVQMPPLSKRPRLDLVESGDLSIEPYDQTTFTENGGRHAEADFHSSSEISGDFDSTKNGVSKSKMAEAVSAGQSNTQPSENQFADASPKDQDANVPAEDDEETGNDSDISDISNLSGESEMAWRPIAAGPMAWVQDQMLAGKDPRVILRRLVPDPDIIPYHLEDLILWKIVASIVTEPPRRKKLKHINTIEDVVAQLKQAKKIMVLTGAGVSVSCGIPDFRSRDGIYARLAVDFPDLPDPQAMFDINYFKHDPRPFFKFAKEIYPGQFEPSHCHKFISLLEKQGKLLRNYTQNIDTLEQVAGISKIIQCHGSFASATCMNCHYKVDAEAIRKDIFDQVIPHCPRCSPSCQEAVMKPDIVFFGESLPEEFHSQMAADKDVCDLLIVVGSSLKVRPVALIPNSLPAEVPQILINREPLHHLNFDVELLGDCDVILGEICHRLGEGWSELFSHYDPLHQVTKEDIPTPDISQEDKKPCFSQQETPQTLQQTTSDSDRVSPSENASCVISEKNYVATDSVRQTVDAKGDNSDITDVKGDNFEGAERFPDVNTVDGETSNKPSLEDVRDWWQSRHNSISSRLAGDQFMFIPPHRYVFSGAEVYSDSESENGQFEDADESSSVDDTEGDGHQNTDVDNLNSEMLENGLESCQTLSSGMESETCCEQRAVQSDPLLTESLDQNKLSAAKDCFIPHPDPTSEIKNLGHAVDTEISEMADKAPSQNAISVERTEHCLATPTIADSCV